MQSNPIRNLLFAVIILILASCSTTISSQNQRIAIRPETTLSIWVEEDIPYMEGRTLDIYAPEDAASWPIVIALHGSGTNSKSLADLSSSIASNGAIVFVPTWSSNPPQSSYITKGWDEVACSMRFAQTYAIERDIFETRIIIIGHSAGGASGFVTLLAADELNSECPSNGNPVFADAFIGLDGAYNILDYVPASRLDEGNPDEWERINPYHYLDKMHYRENVDIVMVTGSEEELEEVAVNFKEEVEKVGYAVTHIRLPELDHWGVANPYQEVMDVILDIIYPN